MSVLGLLFGRRQLAQSQARVAELQEWFDSAMVMVDKIPLGVAWSDPQRDFTVTYVNETGRSMLDPLQPGGGDALAGRRLPEIFAPLAAMTGQLADPARLPLHLEMAMGALTLDLKVVAIRNAQGAYTGAMAVWMDVTQRARLAGDFETNITTAVEELAAASAGMQEVMRSMAGLSAQASERSRHVVAAAGTASGQVRSGAEAAAALSDSLAKIAGQVAESAAVARKAVAEMRQTDETVRSLSAAAEQIGAVVDLIQAIAGQTNLLALNATIEAARAGDAGKGFAVVASEVKSLAAQTAQATDQIRSQVEGIRRAAAEAVGTMQGIGATITEMGESAGAITEAVERQSTGTGEIARRMGEAVDGTSEVSQIIAGVAATSGDVGKAAEQVLASADALSDRAAGLRRQVGDFLATIRTA